MHCRVHTRDRGDRDGHVWVRPGVGERKGAQPIGVDPVHQGCHRQKKTLATTVHLANTPMHIALREPGTRQLSPSRSIRPKLPRGTISSVTVSEFRPSHAEGSSESLLNTNRNK